MTESGGAHDRRRPPRERFAGQEHLFDLEVETDALRREPAGEHDGHRQVTLFHRDKTAIVLFDFEADGRLVDHRADGFVMVQVLSGELRMTTAEAEHVMPSGSLLVLMPNVRHDVRAMTASRMLLTVHL